MNTFVEVSILLYNVLYIYNYTLTKSKDGIKQVVLAYGAESDRAFGIPGEVCKYQTLIFLSY